MVELQVYDAEGKATSKVKFDESVFGEKVKSKTLREVVYAYEANLRQGNANSKNLSDVAGSNKKPWKQKGTGRARTGQKRAPHRKKGSVAHGPHPRSFYVTVPPKMRRLALESALLSKFQDAEVAVVEGLKFDKPKTAKLAGMLSQSGLDSGSVLIGLPKQDHNFFLSSRNLQRTLVRPLAQLNAYEVIKQRRLLLTKEALDALKGGMKPVLEKAAEEAKILEAAAKSGAQGEKAAPSIKEAKAKAKEAKAKKPAAEKKPKAAKAEKPEKKAEKKK
ncbi:50S ribosomal protein L4 [Anaerolineae bacterium]|nr:50S ribosomal protein L4 [Anaerolineae bacterium]